MEYPRYVSHKEVSAAKISEVDPGADGSLTLHLEGGFDNVVMSHHDRRHKPVPEKGWYLVRYEDGYFSFSPAAQFEQGYTLLSQSEGATGWPPAPGSSSTAVIDEDDDDDEEDDEKEDVLVAENRGEPIVTG